MVLLVGVFQVNSDRKQSQEFMGVNPTNQGRSQHCASESTAVLIHLDLILLSTLSFVSLCVPVLGAVLFSSSFICFAKVSPFVHFFNSCVSDCSSNWVTQWKMWLVCSLYLSAVVPRRLLERPKQNTVQSRLRFPCDPVEGLRCRGSMTEDH